MTPVSVWATQALLAGVASVLLGAEVEQSLPPQRASYTLF